MGFGHRVYRVEDPRAKHLRRLALELGKQAGDTRTVEILDTVARVVGEREEHLPERRSLLGRGLRLDGHPHRPVHADLRHEPVAGWAAHVLEQHGNNRLIRPRAEYTGPTRARYVPIDKR